MTDVTNGTSRVDARSFAHPRATRRVSSKLMKFKIKIVTVVSVEPQKVSSTPRSSAAVGISVKPISFKRHRFPADVIRIVSHRLV